MTATEELCQILCERGVKWTDHGYKNHIWWKGFDGVRWHAENRYCVDGWRVKVEAIITPEQAIAATLGREECEVEYVSDWMGWHCKSCDALWQGLKDQPPRFCKECGRRVKR